jgi:hypothetical protein
MMSAATIKQIADEQTALAAKRNLEPRLLFSEETCLRDAFGMPWLGDHEAEGWTTALVEDYASDVPERAFQTWGSGEDEFYFMVDKTGMGGDGGRALEPCEEDLGEVLRAIVRCANARNVNVGLGIIEEGQFQIVVKVYEHARP